MGIGHNLTTSSGDENIAISVQVRPAEESDCDDLWRWRNDPVTKANSLNNNDVPYAQHCSWFASVLSNESQTLIVGLTEPVTLTNQPKVGMVRFDVVKVAVSKNEQPKPIIDTINKDIYKAIVSINVNPDYRGKGLSAPLLINAVASFIDSILLATNSHKDRIKYIEATIKEHNIASIKCFEKAGFESVIGLERHRENSVASQSIDAGNLTFTKTLNVDS